MKKLIVFACVCICVFSLAACRQRDQQDTTNPTQSNNSDNSFHEGLPWDALLNLEIGNDKFLFQRIAVTPCIVYSTTPIAEMSEGTMYDDRHDILAAVFQATNGKEAVTDTPECEFSHYIYMFDKENEDVPWHYRFAFCDCGAVMITNNDELLCTVRIEKSELQTILDTLKNDTSV